MGRVAIAVAPVENATDEADCAQPPLHSLAAASDVGRPRRAPTLPGDAKHGAGVGSGPFGSETSFGVVFPVPLADK